MLSFPMDPACSETILTMSSNSVPFIMRVGCTTTSSNPSAESFSMASVT